MPLNVSGLELFNIPSSGSIEADLNNGTLPIDLQQAFEAQQVPLFEDPEVSTISEDTQWVIDAYSSGNHVKAYTLIKTGASIYVYVNYGDPLDSADFSSENGKLRVMGLREDNRAYIWIQNTDSTWWNYIHELGLDSQTGTLTISGFRSGCTYTVEWWDPWESEVGQQIISSSLVEANVSGGTQHRPEKLSPGGYTNRRCGNNLPAGL